MLFECVLMSFLMFRNDVLQPHFLVNEPSEHSNAMLCGMHREFMVIDFLVIIGKLLIISKGVIDRGIRLARAPGGYASSLATCLEGNVAKNHSVTRSNLDLCGGPVKMSRSDIMPSISEKKSGTSGICAVKSIKNVVEILRDVCGVKEEHPMVSLFLDGDVLIADITKRCE